VHESEKPGADPRDHLNRATRAASLGLAGVVVCLAVFSIVAAYMTQAQVNRAQYFAAIHDSYERANSAVIAGEAAQLESLLAPTAEHSAERGTATNAVKDAFDEIAARGGEADAQLAKELATMHYEYLLANSRLANAIAVGDQSEADRLHGEEDAAYHAIRARIASATAERHRQAESSFADLHDTARWVLVESPVVFTIGFVLLLGLWRVIEQSHRAARETYREIEQLSKLRSEFVSIVSHEFRTPLTGIQGFSEIMRDEEMTPAQTREYAGDINRDARRLARLITDMLDLDRMESGQMTFNAEPVDFNRIVAETAAQFRLSADDHPIGLDLDTQLPLLMGDADRLTQVVNNLVSNAMKYSPNGGAVELRTVRSESSVTLTVRDHGTGIPADMLEAIFDRYSRVLTSETRGVPGIGLGLPIVRQIVQLCDGKVWATSELGQGAVLHVELPLVEAAAIAPLAA
jgi:signal transduction histidine kinase